MPIYEYKCTQCNERHEIIQSINDDPLAHCPKCGGDMKKLISSPAIQFKGSGFYKTDYASPSASPSSSSTSTAASAAKSESTGGSTETKSGDTTKAS